MTNLGTLIPEQLSDPDLAVELIAVANRGDDTPYLSALAVEVHARAQAAGLSVVAWAEQEAKK